MGPSFTVWSLISLPRVEIPVVCVNRMIKTDLKDDLDVWKFLGTGHGGESIYGEPFKVFYINVMLYLDFSTL